MTTEQREARAAERHAVTVARHDALRADALRVANRLPPEFQQWGSMKTRAWDLVARRLRGLAHRKEVRPAEIRRGMALVRSVNDLSIEACVQLLDGAAAEELSTTPEAIEA
jgi:hypothetical protein